MISKIDSANSMLLPIIFNPYFNDTLYYSYV